MSTVTQPNKKIVYEGRIIKVEYWIVSDGRVFERAIRSPGTRVIVYDPEKEQVLLSREFREEINTYDYRLPGGKVCDKIADWDAIKDQPNVQDLIAEACKKEARQEGGIEIQELTLFTVSTSGGSTVDWPLYYFVSTNFTSLGVQNLEAGEEISTTWVSVLETIDICLSGKMQEGRSAAALLQYLHSQGKI